MLDLWLHRPGGSNLSALERPALGAQTSWHALAALSGDGGGVLDLGGGKDVPLFAALNDDEEIVVVGPRPNEVDEDDEGGSWGYGGGAYPGGPEGPGVGEGGGGQLTEPAKDTPCVDEVPAGVDKGELNNLAKSIGAALEQRQEATDWEWGAFIYRGVDGLLHVSAPFTAQLHDSMDGAIAHVPDGAHIVGYIHTHPVDDTMDERTLSGPDRTFIQNITSNGIPNGTVDPNLMAYVTTKDNDTSYHTYVYDKSNRTRTSPGCDL